MTPVRLTDGTVSLSPPGPDDIDAHVEGDDEEIVRRLSGSPATRDGTETYFRFCVEQWATSGPLRAFGIRVVEQGSSVLVGYADMRYGLTDLSVGQVNVTYAVYPRWRGHGLAVRAVRLICGYAATDGAVDAVIRTEPDNVASAGVARGAGFTFVGSVRETDGNRLDRYVRPLAPR